MINEEQLAQSIEQSRLMNQAKTMLSQNVPMEIISQQLGVDRNTLNNLLMQNQLMPDSVLPPEDYQTSYGETGIMSNPVSDSDTNMVIQDIMTGGEESEDIIDFLGVDLGIEGDEEDDNTMTIGQALNSGSLAGVLGGDENAIQSYLDNSSLLESLTDENKLEVYKKAAASIIGEPDYESLLRQPDKVMPYLAAGLSLIKSGEADEDWGSALGKAFISGYGTKVGEEKEYAKGKQALQVDKQNRINQLVTTFGLEDFRNKSQLNRKLMESKMKAPIEIDIVGPSGTFADKSTMLIDEANFASLARTYPESVRESKNQDKKPYTLVDVNGTSVNTWLTSDTLNELTSIPSMAGRVIDGHEKMTNGKLYSLLEDGERVEKFLTQEQYNNLPDGSEPRLVPQTGQPKYVINKEDSQPMWVMPSELMRNPLKYREIDNGFSLTVGENGEMEITQGDRYNIRYSKKQYKEINDKILGVDRGVENYFIAADQLDSVINDFVTEFPEQSDLIFDNLAGDFASFADNIAISLGAFNSMFTAPSNEGGYKFQVGENKVDYEVFRENIIGSTEFEEYRNSPFARMLEKSGISGARLDAALFDMAMLGAGSMNIDKGLDLRAISDFETKQFMKLQGGNTASLKQYQGVANDFRIKLLRRNIAEIDRVVLPSNLFQIQLENGEPDLKAQKVLIDTTKPIRAKMVERLEALENMDTSAKLNTNTKSFVSDASLDPGDDNVITFPTINIDPTSQFGQNLGITEPINTETKLQLNDGEFSYRDLMNNYSKYADDLPKQQSYYQLLRKELTPTQFEILNVHLYKAGLIETQ